VHERPFAHVLAYVAHWLVLLASGPRSHRPLVVVSPASEAIADLDLDRLTNNKGIDSYNVTGDDWTGSGDRYGHAGVRLGCLATISDLGSVFQFLRRSQPRPAFYSRVMQ